MTKKLLQCQWLLDIHSYKEKKKWTLDTVGIQKESDV